MKKIFLLLLLPYPLLFADIVLKSDVQHVSIVYAEQDQVYFENCTIAPFSEAKRGCSEKALKDIYHTDIESFTRRAQSFFGLVKESKDLSFFGTEALFNLKRREGELKSQIDSGVLNDSEKDSATTLLSSVTQLRKSAALAQNLILQYLSNDKNTVFDKSIQSTKFMIAMHAVSPMFYDAKTESLVRLTQKVNSTDWQEACDSLADYVGDPKSSWRVYDVSSYTKKETSGWKDFWTKLQSTIRIPFSSWTGASSREEKVYYVSVTEDGKVSEGNTYIYSRDESGSYKMGESHSLLCQLGFKIPKKLLESSLTEDGFVGDVFFNISPEKPLDNFEAKLRTISKVFYNYKAELFEELASALSEIQSESKNKAIARQEYYFPRLFVLNMIDPVIENSDSLSIQEKLVPSYRKIKEEINAVFLVSQVSEIPLNAGVLKMAIQSSAAALNSSKTYLAKEEDRKELEEFSTALAKLQARGNDKNIPREIVILFDSHKGLIETLIRESRTRGTALMLSEIRAYLNLKAKD